MSTDKLRREAIGTILPNLTTNLSMTKLPTKISDSAIAIKHALLELIQSGDATLVQDTDSISIRLTRKNATKAHAKPVTIATIEPVSYGSAKAAVDKTKSVTIEQVDKALKEAGLDMKREGKKRIYRRASDRPHPDLPSTAEANRLKKQFNIRLQPEIIKHVDSLARDAGMTRQDFVESVILKALDIS